MNDHVLTIDQDPIACNHPFDADVLNTALVQKLFKLFSEHFQEQPRTAARNNHAIRKSSLSTQIDFNDIFGFILI